MDSLAEQLLEHLNSVADEIDQTHVFGAGSSAIQEIVSRLLVTDLDFRQETILTPQDGFVTRARPDFYFPLAAGRGVLAEVERGGAVNNNHDLKDLWKTHIAADAQHLFLVVPNQNVDGQGRGREKPFVRTAHRLAAFFGEPRREIDVLSVHLFGYGQETSAGLGSDKAVGKPTI